MIVVIVVKNKDSNNDCHRGVPYSRCTWSGLLRQPHTAAERGSRAPGTARWGGAECRLRGWARAPPALPSPALSSCACASGGVGVPLLGPLCCGRPEASGRWVRAAWVLSFGTASRRKTCNLTWASPAYMPRKRR